MSSLLVIILNRFLDGEKTLTTLLRRNVLLEGARVDYRGVNNANNSLAKKPDRVNERVKYE